MSKSKTVFQPGKSGNPAGRPKGARNMTTILKEALLQGAEDTMVREFPKIVEAVCKKANEGDMTAAKLIMDRLIPARKAVEFKSGDGKDFGINIVVNTTSGLEEKAEPKIIEGESVDAKE